MMKEGAMTHIINNIEGQTLYALVSSLLGTLISLLAVWHFAASGVFA
jgi:uncharacterized membrane protein